MLLRTVHHMRAHPPAGTTVLLKKHQQSTTYLDETAVLIVHRTVEDDIVGAVAPQCMTLMLDYDTSRKLHCHLESLKYASDTRRNSSACDVEGRVLLQWLVRYFRDKSLSRISLTDASTVDVAGVRGVELRLFRKFCTGTSWYEQYGFLPYEDNERYQASFKAVRNASTDVMRDAMWTLFQAILVKKGKTLSYAREHTVPLTDAHVNSQSKRFQDMASFSTRPVVDVKWFVEHHLWAYASDLYRFLKLTGVTGGISDLHVAYGKANFGEPSIPCKCFYQMAPPRAVLERAVAQNERDDVTYYVRGLYGVLRVFEALGILYCPTELQMRRTLSVPKTPVALTRPCPRRKDGSLSACPKKKKTAPSRRRRR